MITRYALFEGAVKDGQAQEFREAILAEVVPTWRAFPGALAVRVTFCAERDAEAPEYPLILAIDYPDRGALDAALASPARAASRAATLAVLARFFEGRIHHHGSEAFCFDPS